ncbi:MAG: trehalase family glycosidase [Bacillota bacterium]|nr:trehalase family glycosidase [Bacillota bacterium]
MNVTSNWNTWDVRCLNAVMRLPDLAEVRVGIYDDDMKFYQDEMLWKNVRRFGYHDLDGRYFDIDLFYQDFVFNMTFAGDGDTFVYKISPKGKKPYIKFFISGLFRWNVSGSIQKEGGTLLFRSPNGEYKIDVLGDIDDETPVNVSNFGVLVESNKDIYIRCNSEMNIAQMENFLEENQKLCEAGMVKGGGMLKDAPEAVYKGIAWNTIYEPVKNRFCTPVSRAWCTANGTSFGSYVLFEWDTFFAGILSSPYDKVLAYEQVNSIFSEVTKDGIIPNFGSQIFNSEDRSQPPVGAYCLLKLYRQFEEKELLEKYFDKLLAWNRWWKTNRDGNKDGLLEWGSNRYPRGEQNWPKAHDMQSAMYESGLDNSPMYDNVAFNSETNTMELSDVGLNGLYAMDCWALSEIARLIGRDNEALELEKEYIHIKDLINRELWNDEAGIYCNRHWDGSFSSRLSPTNFYPLIAGVASELQAKRMIEEHLLNDKEFWGQYVIPSISKNDEAYFDNNYWRGRIWAPMNFLVSEGLKRYGFYDVSFEFSKKSVQLFLKEWTEKNHIHENYNSITGEGCDVANADPVYTWGGLLGYIAMEELIEFQPWAGIRIGNLSEDKFSISNYHAGREVYDVIKDNGLAVRVNGRPFIEASVPVIITNLRKADRISYMEICSKKSGMVTVFTDSGFDNLKVTVNGKEFEYKVAGEVIEINI